MLPTRSQLRSTLPVLALALALGACARPAPTPQEPAAGAELHGTLETRTCGSISRLHELDGVWLASQPSAEDLEQLANQGVKSVINLRMASEQPDMDEEAVADSLGLKYVRLPIAGPGGMTDENITRARELLSDSPRPLLLHCASANRVGAVWIPWRVLDGGIGIDAAIAEARTIGLRSQELEGKARDYVLRHRH